MDFYYYNKNTDENGYHEVHKKDCSHLPTNPFNREYIGYFLNCKDAIATARKENPSKKFDGCFWCSRDCHNG